MYVKSHTDAYAIEAINVIVKKCRTLIVEYNIAKHNISKGNYEVCF